MKKIRVKNVRSLKDTGKIDLKSINVLVGNNSSGKSTFLRVFPLLKQSFARRINGPILWVGDDGNDVDFGSFEEARSNCEVNGDIELEFFIKFNLRDMLNKSVENRLFLIGKEYDVDKDAQIKICINSKDGNDYISNFYLLCNGDNVRIDNVEKKVYFNDRIIEDVIKNIEKNDSIIENYNANSNSFSNLIKQSLSADNIITNIKQSTFKKEALRDFAISVLINDFFYRISIDVFETNTLNIESNVKKYRKSLENSRLLEVFDKIEIDKNLLNARDNLEKFKLIFLSIIANYCITYMKKYFLNVNYIKPVRAHAERYYRLRNLSVEEIDSDGRNLPMFINSLSKRDLSRYNEWLFENFGFKINTKATAGHVSLNIEIKENSINLSDTGYGYSQLLPIITQLWVATEYKNKKEKSEIPIVFAIEQLELHLHPEMQAKLIDVIARIAQINKGKIQFILETHSETVINRLGNLIYKNKISEKDVNVIVFNKELGDCNTQIKISNFDKDGYLQKWPIGFFSVDDIK